MDDINELALEAITGSTKKPLTMEQKLAHLANDEDSEVYSCDGSDEY